ncbi:CPBP family intramembrane glutamic endopeptidase [Streptococcus caviae]|uniref:CPBP family intramembrane glutamic endopeptidase n=1 Tax=Streptococcus sp. 'caviae' TaxID=1915004 RepID=UPI00094BBE32|nr:type II CAAX endopeptidase family protein [Streptococcus sp. 'caviae']OLN82741.1 CAAX protease family protein [Streptococcus sp. 'caviae']
MNNKKMLQIPINRYKKLPSWLQVILFCLLLLVFEILGSLLGSIALGILSVPVALRDPAIVKNWVSSLYFQLSLFTFMTLLVLFWVKVFERRPISSLGFIKEKWLIEIGKGWLAGTVLFSLSFALSYFLGGLTFERVDLSPATLAYVFSLIPFWFIQSGTEELLTRGWLLPNVYKRTNLAIAVAVSSSLFGLLHLANNNVTLLSIVSIILSGFLMALYMLKTDNIWGVAGLHAAWNFTQGNIFGVAVSGQPAGASILQFSVKSDAAEWLSGGSFGTEGSLLACVVLLCGIAFLAVSLKNENLSWFKNDSQEMS